MTVPSITGWSVFLYWPHQFRECIRFQAVYVLMGFYLNVGSAVLFKTGCSFYSGGGGGGGWRWGGRRGNISVGPFSVKVVIVAQLISRSS